MCALFIARLSPPCVHKSDWPINWVIKWPSLCITVSDWPIVLGNGVNAYKVCGMLV